MVKIENKGAYFDMRFGYPGEPRVSCHASSLEQVATALAHWFSSKEHNRADCPLCEVAEYERAEREAKKAARKR
jgi:hypothetical protein